MTASRAALGASVCLILIAGWAWADAHALQSRLDRAEALDRARAAAEVSLNAASGTPSQLPLLRLLDEGRGFKFLAVRDAAGAVQAAVGRYENIGGVGLPADTLQQLREALYSLTSRHGRMQIQTQTLEGELEYALSDTLRAEVHDQAVARLSRYAVLGLLCGGVFLLWTLRRRTAPVSAQWQSRVQPAAPSVDSAARAAAPVPAVTPAPPLLSEAVLDRVREAIVCTDDAGVIRYANARVATLFGYPREALRGDSLNKLLPVPFLNEPGVRLTDYLVGGSRATQPRVVGWSASAQSFAVDLRVERLGPNSLAVFLRTAD